MSLFLLTPFTSLTPDCGRLSVRKLRAVPYPLVYNLGKTSPFMTLTHSTVMWILVCRHSAVYLSVDVVTGLWEGDMDDGRNGCDTYRTRESTPKDRSRKTVRETTWRSYGTDTSPLLYTSHNLPVKPVPVDCHLRGPSRTSERPPNRGSSKVVVFHRTPVSEMMVTPRSPRRALVATSPLYGFLSTPSVGSEDPYFLLYGVNWNRVWLLRSSSHQYVFFYVS